MQHLTGIWPNLPQDIRPIGSALAAATCGVKIWHGRSSSRRLLAHMHYTTATPAVYLNIYATDSEANCELIAF